MGAFCIGIWRTCWSQQVKEDENERVYNEMETVYAPDHARPAARLPYSRPIAETFEVGKAEMANYCTGPGRPAIILPLGESVDSSCGASAQRGCTISQSEASMGISPTLATSPLPSSPAKLRTQVRRGPLLTIRLPRLCVGLAAAGSPALCTGTAFVFSRTFGSFEVSFETSRSNYVAFCGLPQTLRVKSAALGVVGERLA